MTQRRTIRSLAAVAIATGVLTAACSTATIGTSPPEETASTTTAPAEHDMGSMSMGDAGAPPAASIDGAEVVSGSFTALPDGPANTITGTADLARHDRGTTVTIHSEGLEPGSQYMSHVHADACANSGGPHYQHEIGGSTQPPNEIHLVFTADAEGKAMMTVNNDTVANEFAVAVVIHEMGDGADKLVCADLE